MKQYVDTYSPTDEPVGETDLISTQNSKAADLSDVDGSRQAPYFEEPSDYDDPGARAVPPQQFASAPRPDVRGARVTPPDRPFTQRESLVVPMKDSPASLQGERQAGDQPIELAKADQQQLPERSPERPRGRVSGGVKSRGFTAFEAMRHQLAPYLKEVRDRVERRWIAALELKYGGTWTAEAVLDCAISPDGRLVYVEVVDPGNSVGYAPICKESIEKAAPFPPFPFAVPDVYRNRNLEIRWTFSFL